MVIELPAQPAITALVAATLRSIGSVIEGSSTAAPERSSAALIDSASNSAYGSAESVAARAAQFCFA